MPAISEPEENGLPVDHPAIIALKGLIAMKIDELNRLREHFLRTAKNPDVKAPYENSPTSYDAEYDHKHYYAPSREWDDMIDCLQQMKSLDKQISELRRTMLHCFRDCDFRNGDFWIPLLTTGKMPVDDEE